MQRILRSRVVTLAGDSPAKGAWGTGVVFFVLGLVTIAACFLGLGAALVVTLRIAGFLVAGLVVLTTLGVVVAPGVIPFGSSFPRLGPTDVLIRIF